MKVKFLKHHIKWMPGDVANIDNTQAHYLVRVRVAEYIDNNPQDKEDILLHHLEKTHTPAADKLPKQSKPKTPAKKKATTKTAKKKS